MTDSARPARPATASEGIGAIARRLIDAVRSDDVARVRDEVARLGGSRKSLAPVILALGALAVLFDGVKLLVLNWRLTVIELLPACWIWLTSWNLRQHFLYDRDVIIVKGLLVVVVFAVVVALTVGSFWCNAVFAFAASGPQPPLIRPAASQARLHLGLLIRWGLLVGVAHATATVFVGRLGDGWFVLALAAVLAVMSITFVSVPAKLIGVPSTRPSIRQRLTGAAASGTMTVVLTSPGFLLNRLGLLLIGSGALRIPGLLMFTIGVALQAAASSSVRAVKLGTKLVSGQAT